MVSTSAQNSSNAAKGPAHKKPVAAKRKTASRKNGISVKSRAKNSQGAASRLFRQGRSVVETAYDTASDVSSSLPKISRNLHLRERGQTVYDMVENRPLIFGAVGLGVGVVIAALLPSTKRRSSKRR
jgi:hypothetical protein